MKASKLLQYSFYASLIMLPVTYRHMVFSAIPGFDEYEALFFSLSDIVIAFFMICAARDFWRVKKPFQFSPYLTFFLWAFVYCVGVSILFATSQVLAIYIFLRFVFLVVFALAIAWTIARRVADNALIFSIFAVWGIVESTIAFLQVLFERSIGLSFLGEEHLTAQTAGVAKITIEGAQVLRGYGTFPHPNVLGAFLVIGLISLAFLWLKNGTNWRKVWFIQSKRWNTALLLKNIAVEIILAVGFYVTALGIMLTFSRTAWAVAAVSMLVVIGAALILKDSRRQALKLLVLLIVLAPLLAFKFSVLTFPRATVSMSEPAVVYRENYNVLGLAMMMKNPMGVGIGNQVLRGVKDGSYKLLAMTERWQWQPIHNLYLLAASETGIFGLISLAEIMILAILGLWAYRRDARARTAGAMLFALLLFGLTDHFLWDLEPGRLMLWAAIGIVMGFGMRPIRAEAE